MPHPHRPLYPGCAQDYRPCTWRRSSPQRTPHHPQHATLPLHARLSRRVEARARQLSPPPQPHPRDHRHHHQASQGVAELYHLQQLRQPTNPSRTTRYPTSARTWSASSRTSPDQAATCTGPGTPPRTTRSWRTCSARPPHKFVKLKSMATQKTGLNDALQTRPSQHPHLPRPAHRPARRRPTHPHPVPPIHLNRPQIGELFRRTIPDPPPILPRPSPAPRRRPRPSSAQVPDRHGPHLRRNFAFADTPSLIIVESEANGRMCLTLSPTLISVVCIDKILPSWRDLEVFLTLLPLRSTAQRITRTRRSRPASRPATPPRISTCAARQRHPRHPRRQTGPQALHCIRCSACLNLCQVYERAAATPTARRTRNRSAHPVHAPARRHSPIDARSHSLRRCAAPPPTFPSRSTSPRS